MAMQNKVQSSFVFHGSTALPAFFHPRPELFKSHVEFMLRFHSLRTSGAIIAEAPILSC